MQQYLQQRQGKRREKLPWCPSWMIHQGCQARANGTCQYYHKRSANEPNLCPRILSGNDCDATTCPWLHDNALAALVLAEQAQVRDRWLDTVNEILALNTDEQSRAKAITDLRYLCPLWLQKEYPSLKPLGDAIKTILDSAQEGDHDSDAATQHNPDRSQGSN